MTLDENKVTLRRAMIAWRAGLDETDRRAAAEGLVTVLRRERPVEAPAIVAGFWPIKDEIDIRPLMNEFLAQGCRLALPVVHKRGEALTFRSWRPGDALEAGAFGTLQPLAEVETLDPDVLLVPLLACDEDGYRLGYGGGFYDRTLAGVRQRRAVTAIGIGFDGQLVPVVPHGPQDERLDWLLTDKRACAFV